jgi:hypothetical protein
MHERVRETCIDGDALDLRLSSEIRDGRGG